MINTGCLEIRVEPFKNKGTWICVEVLVRKLGFGGIWLKGDKPGEAWSETFTHVFPCGPGAKSTLTLEVSVFAVMVIRTVVNN